jgi:MoaA/NifB/PqqE/SkfB family radical SAM enzyme
MHNPYDDAFLEQLKPYLENIKEAKFYGGEPFLIPMYFRILQVIAAINPTCELFIITNGTHWSSKIEALTRDLNMDVAISIDSLQKPRLEKIRKNASFEKLIENIHRFNAIMRSKNRHLSLSFTIQQENWDELADFVRFCNSIEASVYVSYLDSPKHYAIAELSQEQLKQIHNELSSEILPTDTDLHCHNARCLADFISYVHRYITNQDEPQYDEYHESFLGRNHDSADFIMVDKEVSKEDLLQAFEQYLASSAKHKMFTALELFARLENVHNTFEPHHHALLRGMALQSDMTATFNSLTTQTAEELSTSLRKNLHRIRLR